jgi:hypothetical protein
MGLHLHSPIHFRGAVKMSNFNKPNGQYVTAAELVSQSLFIHSELFQNTIESVGLFYHLHLT